MHDTAPSVMTREDSRSLALSRAAVQRLSADWDRWVPMVRRNLDLMRARSTCSRVYLDRWEDLLARGPEEVAAVVLAPTDEGQVLRSIHPFAGILHPRERWALLAERAREEG